MLVTRAHDQLVQNVRPALLMLLGAVALMLLIACANVASLLLVRAVDRQRELAVRAALGASRGRIIRQLVVESLVLAVAGGMLGLVLGGWGLSLLTLTALPSFPRAASIDVAWPVGLFAMAPVVLTGIAFGILPALQASRFDLNASLNEEGAAARAAAATGARAPPSWWRRSPSPSCCWWEPGFSCEASPHSPRSPPASTPTISSW